MHCHARNIPARSAPGALPAVILLAMSACGSNDDADRAASGSDGTTGRTPSELPAPEGAIGSVTGMPAHPGPGTSRIVPVEAGPVAADPSAQDAWADDAYDATYGGAYDHAYTDVGVDGERIAKPALPEPGVLEREDPIAGSPPIIIVPELPRERPVAIDAGPDSPATTTSPPEPIGTEAATESTTIVVEPADTDD